MYTPHDFQLTSHSQEYPMQFIGDHMTRSHDMPHPPTAYTTLASHSQEYISHTIHG